MDLKKIDAMIGPVAIKEAEALEAELPALAREWAQKYPDDMEAYVDLVPGLSERDKEARRDIWRVANQVWDAPVEPTAPAPTPAAPAKTKNVGGVTYVFDGQGWIASP